MQSELPAVSQSILPIHRSSAVAFDHRQYGHDGSRHSPSDSVSFLDQDQNGGATSGDESLNPLVGEDLLPRNQREVLGLIKSRAFLESLPNGMFICAHIDGGKK